MFVCGLFGKHTRHWKKRKIKKWLCFLDWFTVIRLIITKKTPSLLLDPDLRKSWTDSKKVFSPERRKIKSWGPNIGTFLCIHFWLNGQFVIVFHRIHYRSIVHNWINRWQCLITMNCVITYYCHLVDQTKTNKKLSRVNYWLQKCSHTGWSSCRKTKQNCITLKRCVSWHSQFLLEV